MAGSYLAYAPVPKSWRAVRHKGNLVFLDHKGRTTYWPPWCNDRKPDYGEDWETRLTEKGMLYYVNHRTKHVQALPPLDLFLDAYENNLLEMLPHTIIDALRESGILTNSDFIEIRGFASVRQQNETLVSVLRAKRTVRKEELEKALCDGFCRSNQVCPFRKDGDRQPITPWNRELLRKMRKILIENFHSCSMMSLRDELIEARVVDTELDEMIKWDASRTTLRDVVDMLLYVIAKCHNGIIERFILAVKKCNPHIAP